MNLARVNWTPEMKARLIAAFAAGELKAAYAAFPELRSRQVNRKLQDIHDVKRIKSARDARRAAMELSRKNSPVGPSTPARLVVVIPRLNPGQCDYVRRRVEHEMAVIASELKVSADSVRLALYEIAAAELKPKPLRIETETNAVDRAYGDAATTVSFKFGARG